MHQVKFLVMWNLLHLHNNKYDSDSGEFIDMLPSFTAMTDSDTTNTWLITEMRED